MKTLVYFLIFNVIAFAIISAIAFLLYIICPYINDFLISIEEYYLWTLVISMCILIVIAIIMVIYLFFRTIWRLAKKFSRKVDV